LLYALNIGLSLITGLLLHHALETPVKRYFLKGNKKREAQ
jgi:hypothetical protein